VKIVPQSFGISWVGLGITDHVIQVIALPGMLVVRRDIISEFVRWTLAPKSDVALEMM
jgi:hypothetical protein